MHFDLADRLDDAALADVGACVRKAIDRGHQGRRGLHGDDRAGRRHDHCRARGHRPLPARRGPRGRRLPRVAAQGQLRAARRARVRLLRRRDPGRRGLRAGHPARRGELGLRASPSRCPSCRPRCASGRRAATCCWSPRRTRSRRCTGTSGWTTSASGASRATGEIVGESRLLGLFTSKAFAERASETPLLHRKLRQALDAEDLIEGSHDYKAAVALFDSFPKEELFSAPVDDLRRAVVALTGLEGTERVRLLGRRDPDGRSVSLILSLPRSRYSAPLVAKMTKLLKRRFGTDGVEAHHVMDEGARVRVHFFVHAAEGLNEVPGRELEAEAIALARTWDDELAEELADQPALFHTWSRASRSTTRATRRRSWRRSTSPASLGWTRASRSSSACTGSARTGRRGSRSTSATPRSSSRARCRCSRTSGCA